MTNGAPKTKQLWPVCQEYKRCRSMMSIFLPKIISWQANTRAYRTMALLYRFLFYYPGYVFDTNINMDN